MAHHLPLRILAKFMFFILLICAGCAIHLEYIPASQPIGEPPVGGCCVVEKCSNLSDRSYEEGWSRWFAKFYDDDIENDLTNAVVGSLRSKGIFDEVHRYDESLPSVKYDFICRPRLLRMKVNVNPKGYAFILPSSVLVGILPIVPCSSSGKMEVGIEVLYAVSRKTLFDYSNEVAYPDYFYLGGWPYEPMDMEDDGETLLTLQLKDFEQYLDSLYGEEALAAYYSKSSAQSSDRIPRKEEPRQSPRKTSTAPTDTTDDKKQWNPSKKRWALVLGISDYKDNKIPDIPNAAEDAAAIRDFLLNKEGGGFSSENVLFLTDETATRKDFRKQLIRLKDEVGGQDDLLLYFACHGSALPEPKAGNADGLEKYFLLHDAEHGDLKTCSISMSELERELDDIDARHTAMIVDTCFSGGARSVAMGVSARNSTISSSFLKRLARQAGEKHRKILTACSANELALDDPDSGHGIFTTYLLSALKNAPDIDGNGELTLFEVYRDIDMKVRKRSRDILEPQHPQWVGNPEIPFVLKKITP